MYTKIKQLADEAIALQNKDRMDAALREISDICGMTTECEVLHEGNYAGSSIAKKAAAKKGGAE